MVARAYRRWLANGVYNYYYHYHYYYHYYHHQHYYYYYHYYYYLTTTVESIPGGLATGVHYYY